MTYTPTVLFLNSAQSKYPCGDDPWVQATIRAFERISESNAALLTSSDPLMWDFTLYLASKYNRRIRHIVPDYDLTQAKTSFQDMLTSFAIDRAQAEHVPCEVPRSASRADVWRQRDRLAIENADVIYPVCIRPGGRLESLLQTAADNGKDIRDTFRIGWSNPNRRSSRYDFAEQSFNALPKGDWLIHWTRTSQGPWPGESKASFFSDMLSRPSMYVRSARETLARIVRDRVIQASGWRIPAGTSVVSLTENTPETAITLMRWRKRFVRYTYEPYGIAIRREFLMDAGARKVTYATHAGEPGDIPWAVQSPGMVADWTREREWRYPGDINLSDIDRSDWFPIVPALSDAAYIAMHSGVSVEQVHVLFAP